MDQERCKTRLLDIAATFQKPTTMTLSLCQAFNAKQSGEISWDTYIHVLLARCTGIKHEEDNVKGTYPKLRYMDPFGHMIWMWSKRMKSIEDASALEAVFKAYRYGSLDDVKTKLALLEDVPIGAIKEIEKSLALLACQERRADVLKYCLDQGGFPIDPTMRDEAKSVDAEKDPETFIVLQQAPQFQEIREREERNRRQRAEREQQGNGGVKKWKKDENGNMVLCKCGAPPGVEAVFDVGGALPVDW